MALSPEFSQSPKQQKDEIGTELIINEISRAERWVSAEDFTQYFTIVTVRSLPFFRAVTER